MPEKPTTAFVLSLIAGIFILLGGLVVAALTSFIGGALFTMGMGEAGIAAMALGTFGVICGIIVIVGATMINSTDKGRVQTGSILVLIFSIISWIGAFGGFVIGFLLGLIGAILGLTWRPMTEEKPPAPPPPPP